MTFEEIEFALKVNGVEQSDADVIMSYCRSNGTDYQKLDEMLVEMGYDKVFAEEFFGLDDLDIEEDDDFFDDEMYS
jgi:hypothetical protein